MPKSPVRIPMTTVGGYLGAGKTTFVNRFLSSMQGQRIVVFVNDFGAINIDSRLVETIEEDRISLKNGCVCCTLNDDLIAQIAEHARGADHPDGFLIEASGVANPNVLDASLGVLEQAGLIRVDMRFCIIDADNFQLLPYEARESVIDGAVASDVVILNKTDLADALDIAVLEETFRVSAPHSNVLKARHCDIGIPLSRIIASNNVVRSPGVDGARRQMKPHEHHLQWSVSGNFLVDRCAFETFARNLPDLCWRAKGILRLHDQPQSLHVFHFVGRRATIEYLGGGDCDDDAYFVAIGAANHFCADDVEAQFNKTIFVQSASTIGGSQNLEVCG